VTVSKVQAGPEYHYVITLQFKREGEYGVSSNTIEGTVPAHDGATRQELYQVVYQRACKALDVASGVTVFCMLEPNALVG
jgi:hypothetical protein